MLDKLASFSSNTIFFSLAGGVLPALFWLWYWLREDTEHPEPRALIARTFFAGMIAAVIAIPIESIAYQLGFPQIALFVWVAITEELAKYSAAHHTGLVSKAFDEPIDAMIYLITAALGFSAFENTLFIASSLTLKGFSTALLVGQTRFIGASLLHIVASSLVGAALAFAFYKDTWHKKRYFHEGLILAVALHTAFNFFIIKTSPFSLLFTLTAIWFSVLCLLLLFERVKKIRS